MTSLLGPEGTPLRRTRSVLTFFVVALLGVAMVAAALGRVAPIVWALVLAAVFVVGHLWSWPREAGRPVATAELTLDLRTTLFTGVAVGVASGFAVVVQGGSAGQGLVQTAVTTVLAVPLLLLLRWWGLRKG